MIEQNQPITESISNNIEASSPPLIGNLLKKKRLALSMKISDISTFLKVKKSDIEAVESDDLSGITKHLYATGLIRSYAKLLKIDPEIVEEQIKLLSIESNTKNTKHQLINIGENIDLTPDRDSVFNFLLISILLLLILLSLYNASENKSGLIPDQEIISELEKVSS